MAVRTYTGTFTKLVAPATGLQQITGIPFLPKALYFLSVGRVANGTFEVSRWFCQGVATATEQRVVATNGLEGGNGGVTGNSSYASNAQVMAFTYNNIFGPNVGVQIALVSIDTIAAENFGFTLNTTLNGAGIGLDGAVIIHYVAFGGDFDVALKQWTTGELVGTYPITGVGFRPDLLLSIATTNAPFGVANGATSALMCCNCALQQWAINNTENTFGAEPAFPIVSLRQQLTDVNSIMLGFLGGVTGYARLISMDPDGWTTAVDAPAGQSAQWFSLCFKGVASQIGAFNKNTAPGAQAILASNFTPTGLLLASDQLVASAGIEDYARLGVGFFDGTRQGAVAAISPTDTLTGYGGIDYTGAAFVKINNTAGTVDALATGVSLDASGAVVNWTTSDASATQILYLMLGSDGDAGMCETAQPVEWVWEVPETVSQCICVTFVNDAGEPLEFAEGHCPTCVVQPFFPQLFAESERRSVPVPMQNNLIQTWIYDDPLTGEFVLLNDDGEILEFVTAGLVLSKANANLFGHYLGWMIKGTDAPFRIETVEMEYQMTRTWDAP